MKKYTFTVIEKRTNTVIVEAETASEAKRLAEDEVIDIAEWQYDHYDDTQIVESCIEIESTKLECIEECEEEE